MKRTAWVTNDVVYEGDARVLKKVNPVQEGLYRYQPEDDFLFFESQKTPFVFGAQNQKQWIDREERSLKRDGVGNITS